MEPREKLKRLRSALGYSQEAFSELLDVNSGTYSGYESGRYNLPEYIAGKLHELYGIDAAAFADAASDTYLPPGGIPERPQQRKRRKRRAGKSAAKAQGTQELPERCDSCMFALRPAKRALGCAYMAYTGRPRGCPAGDRCTRYMRNMRRSNQNREEGKHEFMD